MLKETMRRRPGFRPGTLIRLFDGQEWVFPGPAEVPDPTTTQAGSLPDGHGVSPDPAYPALLAAVLESEDESEQFRAELALAICLLTRNYTLAPDDYRLLFEATPGDARGVAVRQAFHDLAVDHLRNAPPRHGVLPSPARWVRALFRLVAGL